MTPPSRQEQYAIALANLYPSFCRSASCGKRLYSFPIKEKDDIRVKTSGISTLFLLGIFSAVCLAEVPTSSANDTAVKREGTVINSMTLQSLQQFVQAMGFECTRGKDEAGKDDSFFTFRAEGYKVVVFVNNPTSILLYNAFTDLNPTLTTVNEWNQNTSFSRAYIDKEGNAVLESDLIFTGGVTHENVEVFVKTFRDSLARWARFALDRKK
jgi:hypothetical protein